MNTPKSIPQVTMKTNDQKTPPAPPPSPKKPVGLAGMTLEEQLASHNRGMAEWKAKHGDKPPKVH